MQITYNHPASLYGQPVILSDSGELMDYPEGVRAVMDRLGMDRVQLAEACGVSARTVDGWRQQGRPPLASALNMMAQLLADCGANLKAHTPSKTPKTEDSPSLVLYSGEGTITVTRHADGKATIEMFDQRTIRDLIDKEDRIKLAEFLSENA